MSRGRSFFIGAALAVLAAATGALAAAGPSQRAEYEGRRAQLQIIQADGGERRARFTARHIELVCADDTFPRVDFARMGLRFVGPNVFQGQRYRRDDDGDWSYYEVKGRVRGRTRASGYIIFVGNPHDPPGAPDRDECSTGGQLYYGWTAHRNRDDLSPLPRHDAPQVRDVSGGYAGTIESDPDSLVTVDPRRTGERRAVTFDASGLELECDDGTSLRIDPPRMAAHFAGGNAFEGRFRPIPQDDGRNLFVKVEGEVLANGDLAGIVFAYQTHYETPALPGAQECHTGGLLRWRAEPVAPR